MSDSANIREKYQHNEDFVEYVKKVPDFPDWEIIGIFYAALYYMNLYLNKRFNISVEDIDNHSKRNRYIQNNCSDNIARAYITLYSLSREARYQFTDVSGKTNFVRNKYKELKSLCQNSMSAALR